MELTIINAVLLAVVTLIGSVAGYFIAAARSAAKLATQAAQLQTVNDECATVLAKYDESDRSHRTLLAEYHRLEVDVSSLREKYASSRDAVEKAESRYSELKAELLSERENLSSVRSQAHSIEKQYESALADLRSWEKRSEEYSLRLEVFRKELNSERQNVANLKDLLGEEGKKAKAAETAEKDAREQLVELKTTLVQEKNSLRGLQDRYQSLLGEFTELKTSEEMQAKHYKEQLEQLSETKESFTKEFENLANRIFEEKGQSFSASSKKNIESMLAPFREQIAGFQKRVDDVHDASLKGNTTLNSEIQKVLEIGMKMSSEANNLTSALKGDSQQRGAWGEAQLRRTLEMSGLVEDAHYEVQSAFKDNDGKQKQTDYIVKLPDSKHIIIDSKVSLIAYDRAVGAESPEEYKVAMNEHVKAVRKHIDELAFKDYTNLVGMHSPSFVLMFMPIEPAYIEAMKNNKDLFEYGFKKNIVLVSHTTLIPILRTVSNLWMIERSNSEAREIAEKAGEIYNQVCVVSEHLMKLGGSLTTVSNHFNRTATALAGKQGLHGKVERFSQISSKVSKSLPPLEPVHMDFESERLSLIVEPIVEDEADSPLLDAELENELAQNAIPQ